MMTFAWRDYGKPRKSLVRIIIALTEIRNKIHPNKQAGFDSRSSHVGFLEVKAALEQVAGIFRVLPFPLPILPPQTVPYSLFVLSWTLYSLDTGSVVK
jgi:hypothetical protein